MPVIPAIWETESRRIMVRGHPGQTVLKTPSPKQPDQKWTGGVDQMVIPASQMQSPEFKPQSHKKKKKQAQSKRISN
jgi:hypothetical protein